MTEREKAASMMGNCSAARIVYRSTLYEVTAGSEGDEKEGGRTPEYSLLSSNPLSVLTKSLEVMRLV